MPRHPIYDFILSITTSNVVWWNKDEQSIFQEVTHATGLRSSTPPMAGYLATIRTCERVSILKAYQNFKSEDNDNLSITNWNRAWPLMDFRKLSSRSSYSIYSPQTTFQFSLTPYFIIYRIKSKLEPSFINH